jgi:DNA-directed RNA polymerase specialized sigma24 family protein
MKVLADSHLWSLVRTQEGWFVSMWNSMRTRVYGIFNDRTLVLRARSGDFVAFDALAARYADRLYAMAFSSLGNTAEATAVLCEAMRSAFRDIDSVEPRCSPGTWLHLHCLRAVLQRLDVPPGRYTVTHEVSHTRSERRRRSRYAGAA